MQIIYKQQKNLTSQAEHDVSFLGPNQDQEVLNALQSKKISNLQRTALEGKLMKQEHQLMKHMKNSSAPGIDSFTVVKEFWRYVFLRKWLWFAFPQIITRKL